MDVGALLRQAREEGLLTQRQLAAQLGVPPSTLSRYESGRASPSLAMLDRILAGCGKQLQAKLVQRHADLDAELDRLAALSHRDRLGTVDLLTADFLRQLGDAVLIGGAWAAALHGLPHEHDEGRLWIPQDAAFLTEVAGLLHRRMAWLYVDGEPCSPVIRPETFARHPTARWKLTLVGYLDTILVPAGGSWPEEIRLDRDLGPLRVVTARDLGPGDGVRPEVLAHWLGRRVGSP